MYIFLRHGQSVANAEGWLSGWEDVALTAAGEEEARIAGQELENHPIARVLVSDLRRAQRTAELALGGRRVPVHVLPELRERRMGVFMGESIARLREDGRFATFLAPWDARPPGGESHAEALRRVVAALKFWQAPGTTLVVGHGGWMRDLLARLEGVPPEEIGLRPPAKNAHPVWCQIRQWPGSP